MRRMIVAQLYRLRREPVFWGGLLCTAVYALVVLAGSIYGKMNYGFSPTLDQLYFYGYGLNGLIPVSGLILAGAVSFFVGTQYSGGTLRSALVVSRTRAEIYISHYLVSAAMALAYHLFYTALILAIGWPVFGGFQLDAGTLALGALAGVLALGAYCALFNAVGLLCSSRTVTSILCLSGVILAMFLGAYISSRLQEPARVDVLEMRDGSSQVKSMENPRYLPLRQRRWAQGLLDVLPSGQCLQLGSQKLSHWRWLPGISAGLIVFVNAGGLFLFQRKELK